MRVRVSAMSAQQSRLLVSLLNTAQDWGKKRENRVFPPVYGRYASLRLPVSSYRRSRPSGQASQQAFQRSISASGTSRTQHFPWRLLPRRTILPSFPKSQASGAYGAQTASPRQRSLSNSKRRVVIISAAAVAVLRLLCFLLIALRALLRAEPLPALLETFALLFLHPAHRVLPCE